jgi:ATP diphosphatase
MQRLMQLIQKLRHPETGCPWDLKQDFQSYCKSLNEETQEVLEAIRLGDMENLKEELGDVLFNICFFIQLAQEKHYFTAEDVIKGVEAKMIYRHPHVFGDEKVKTAEEALALFNKMKQEKKKNDAS